MGGPYISLNYVLKLLRIKNVLKREKFVWIEE
jgi:hypothetical protein